MIPSALLAALLAGICLFAPAGATAAEPPQLGEFCETGSAAGQCNIPRGIAVDADSGHVYVGDQSNHRIQEFDAWGSFVRAWGWGVLDGSAELQTCTQSTGCVSGLQGEGAGQLVFPQGVAVDSAGDVYVVDFSNHRVQKFHPPADPEAPVEFVLTFGGDVNKTKIEAGGATEAERNLCTAASGDVCQMGIQGAGDGQFNWPKFPGSFIAIAQGPPETVYVGDEGRIQEFDLGGSYLGDLPDPGGVLSGETVKSLAVDPTGNLYLSFVSPVLNDALSKDDVLKLDPAGNKACPGGGVLKVARASAVAADASGQVHVVSARQGGTGIPMQIVRLDAASCTEIDRFNARETGFSASTGLATSSACGLQSPDLFIANAINNDSFVRLYGPPPDPSICPPPEKAATIADQYALSVGSDGASVGADINPHFWPTTTFWVQYGTGKCSEGGCTSEAPLPPGTSLTEEVKDAAIATPGVFLDDLEPNTTYHFRFVARTVFEPGSGEVAEVRGVGGEVGIDGAEASFRTFPEPLEAKTDCPNQIFRGGLAAPLPDCRAYELVSPLDKNNGDVETDPDYIFGLVSPDGNRATYTSFRSFADPQGAPLNSPYLSSRDPKTGWSTHSISPPRSSVAFYPPLSSPNNFQFKAFSEDLCTGWLLQDSNVALVEGAPDGVANLYRRQDRDCGTESYGLLTPVAPPGYDFKDESSESVYYPTVQGVSADSSRALLRVNAVLTADACQATTAGEVPIVEGKGLYQLYLQGPSEEDLHLVSVLSSGEAACVHSSAGTGQGEHAEFREDNVHHAISADASRVFWSASADTTPAISDKGDQKGPLYLRLNPSEPQSALELGAASGTGNLKTNSKFVSGLSTASGAFAAGQSISGPGIAPGTTIATASASSLTLSIAATKDEPAAPLGAWSDCTEPEKACTLPISTASDARFWGADPDGETAIYTAAGGLFEYDVESQTSTQIAATGVDGVMGMSTDTSRVYFASTAALTGEEQNSEGKKATAGKPNLYLHEKGAGTVFLGTLSERDAFNGSSVNSPPSPVAELPRWRAARVSPDGLHAAFTSAASLTDYDNNDAVSGEPDAEVYLYDAEPGGAGELRCVSCNPSGSRPHGRNVDFAGVDIWHAARIPGWPYQLYASRLLANDGNRLFFESFDALVLRDTNGRADVYEWQRADGEKECEEVGAELYAQEAEGCISLISSGKSAEDSYLLDASEGGADVTFITAGSLLAEDFGLFDVYDARTNGGFPPPAGEPPICEGEACQPPAAPPQPQTPASASFQGAGNVVEAPSRRRCGKGRRAVRRAGKALCVPKKQKGKRAKQKRARNHGRATR